MACCTASQNNRRPKAPPDGTTWTLTWLTGRFRSNAMAFWVAIGLCRPAQTSALLGRTSAMAHSTSSGAWAAAAHSNSASTTLDNKGGNKNGTVAWRNFLWMLASDSPSIEPGPHSTSSALTASQACPKVSAITATPGGLGTKAPPPGITAIPITPGMRRTAPSLRMRLKVPRMVGGLRTMVGLASGTSWSRVNFFLPVTMSSASTLRVGLPITWY